MTDHRKQSKYLKLLRDTGQLTEHFKMYKSGKNWLFAGISLLTFGAGLAINQSVVKADDAKVADSSSDTTVVNSSAGSNSDSTVTLKSASSTTSDASSSNDTVASDVSNKDSEGSSSSESNATSGSNSTASAASADTTNSNATSVTTDATNSSSAASSNNTADQDATSSDTSSDVTKLATLQTELPAGTVISTQSDGTTVIELPVNADIDLAKQMVDATNLVNAVTVTARADTSTGPLTYTGGLTSGTVYNGVTQGMATAVTMGDFEWITAVGTGMLNGKATSLADIDNYFESLYNANKGNYRLFGALRSSANASAADEATEANAASFMYYYFLGSDNSYVSGLIKYLNSLNTTQLASLAQTVYENNDIDISKLITQQGTFVLETFYGAGTSSPVSIQGGDLQISTSENGSYYWKIPFSGSENISDFENFVNSIVSLYIAAMVPGAETYVIETVLPAIDTVSDTTALTDYTNLDSIIGQIGDRAYQTAKSLLTIDGSFDLTSLVPHIGTLYDDATILSMFDSGSGGFLGRFVGAIDRVSTTDGKALSYNADTLSGNAIGFNNFSLFNSLYVAYAEVLVKVLYGTAMLGKFEAIQAMYNDKDAFINYMSGRASADVNITDFEKNVLGITTTNTLSTDTQTLRH
ncbi:hypothetical protein LOOC260_107900 [Paucilactobacillus hokkaidonensis JCM 18461]|uniref:Uncharacterized protein n=2 Tax=Paucilactobacillus hokkaidonensis TaxID=1193095 RepID=A0A0A1GTK5_9LACO|nr:KxYKxGKxW signal peptide domain-containing protein [Paucilactobacillus hokkaidonensis]KRO10157.1 hypothetical protein IV59_GL002179 [Paucilactobacillus hokkaidonensis]BAP85330.1 hypothetical protein LOOC260_107900 [Paucilactobacillus hokkaidonensis JCM 18461]